MQEQSLEPKSRVNLRKESSKTKAKNKVESSSSKVSFDLKEGAAKNPNREKIALLLANADLLLKHGEVGLAQSLVYQALALDSFHAEALKKLIKCKGSADLAFNERIFNTLLKVDYGFENLAELAHVLYLQSKDKEALIKYQEALSCVTEETKGLFEVYKNLGNILVREGDFDGAEEYYNKAYEVNPDSDTLLVNLGTLEIQKKQFNEALERFRKALELNSKNDKAWVGLAMVHNTMGDTVLAKANLENAIDAQGKNRTAVHLFASWCVRDQNYGAGITVLQNYLSKVDCDEEMSLVLIHIYCLTNQYDLALLEAERVLLWNPKNTEIQKIEQSLRQSR